MTARRLRGQQRRFRLTPPSKAAAILVIIVVSWFLGGALLELTAPKPHEPATVPAKPPIVIVAPPAALPRTVIDADVIERLPRPDVVETMPEGRIRL